MIIDTAMVRDELDVLEMRLEELDGKADHHVLVEAAVDFHGRPKPLHLWQNLDRFSKWRHKMTVITVDALPEHPNPWVREHAQRDAMMTTVREVAMPEDIILICDLDELPSDRALKAADEANQPVGLLMSTAHSAVDWLYPQEEPGSVLCQWRHLKGATLSQVRDGRPSYPMVRNGGWHFSWLGGPEKQSQKLAVTCHLELPFEERMILGGGLGYRNGRHVGVQMVPADVDETWPAFIRERRCPGSWFRPRQEDA